MPSHFPELRGGIARRPRFYFATEASDVAPTNEAAISQAQVEPGIPEPSPGNVSPDGVSLGVVGDLRQDAASDPTVEVRIESLTGYTPPRSVGTVAEGLIAASLRGRVSVPRYSIRRTGYDQQADDAGQVGVSSAWSLAQEIDFGAESAIIPEGAPSLATDRHGNLIAAVALWLPATGPDQEYPVRLYRLKPGASPQFEQIASLPVRDIAGVSPDLTFTVNLVRRGDDLYLSVVMTIADLGDGGPSIRVRTYLLVGTDGDDPQAILIPPENGLQWAGNPTSLSAADTPGGVLFSYTAAGGVGLRLARTDDFRNFEQINSSAGLVSFSEFVVGASPSAASVGQATDIYDAGSGVLWATTTRGIILGSTDGGRNWARRTGVPTDPILTTSAPIVPLNSITGAGDNIIAVGGGAVVQSTDAGATWKVTRYAPGLAAAQAFFQSGLIDATEIAKSDWTSSRLRKVRATVKSTGPLVVDVWAVGDGGTVVYTADLGETWVTIQSLGSRGYYSDLVVHSAGTDQVVFAVGSSDVHASPSVHEDHQGARAILLVDAVTSGATKSYYLPGEDRSLSPVLRAATVERNGTDPDPKGASARGYVISEDGHVYRWTGTGSAMTFTLALKLEPSEDAFVDLRSPDQSTGGAAGALVAASFRPGGVGAVWQIAGAHGSTPTAVAQAINDRPRVLAYTSASAGVLAGELALWRSAEARNFRSQASLLSTRDGAVLLSCLNGTKGWVETYRAERPGPGQTPSFRLTATIPVTAGYGTDLAEYIDGSVILAIGRKHFVSLDGGLTWVPSSSKLLPIPLADQGTTADYDEAGSGANPSLRSSRRLIEYGGGVLYAVAPSVDATKLGIFKAWDWSADGPFFRPVLAGVPLSLGVDGARVVFTGDPAPRDTWTIRPRYGYRASHVVADSPSTPRWRSKDNPGQQVFEWDAQADSVTRVLGPRSHWTASFVGLFGTNFGRAAFAISDPANDAVLTTRDITVAMDSGVAVGPGGALASNVFYVAGKQWTPGQWNPGTRRYFARFANQNAAFPIRRSGVDWIEVEGVANLSGGATSRGVTIYADRLCWRGDDGSGPGSAGLLGSQYAHGRILRVTLPEQPTPDPYLECGRIFWGYEVAPDDEGRSILYGMSFRPVTHTEQDIARTGLKSLRHYGQTGMVYEIEFGQETPDARDRRVAALLERMRTPFVIQWDGTDMQTCDLLRLVDSIEYGNTYGARFNSRWLLEVVA